VLYASRNHIYYLPRYYECQRCDTVIARNGTNHGTTNPPGYGIKDADNTMCNKGCRIVDPSGAGAKTFSASEGCGNNPDAVANPSLINAARLSLYQYVVSGFSWLYVCVPELENMIMYLLSLVWSLPRKWRDWREIFQKVGKEIALVETLEGRVDIRDEKSKARSPPLLGMNILQLQTAILDKRFASMHLEVGNCYYLQVSRMIDTMQYSPIVFGTEKLTYMSVEVSGSFQVWNDQAAPTFPAAQSGCVIAV
jgi:hypothetical protein